MNLQDTNKRQAQEPDWDSVLRYLPMLESADFRVGQWCSRTGTLPFFELSADAALLLEALDSSGVIYDFDWPSWQSEAERLTSERGAIAHADLATSRKLLVTHVRKDRFCEGHFAGMLRSGHIAAILRRVAQLRSKS